MGEFSPETLSFISERQAENQQPESLSENDTGGFDFEPNAASTFIPPSELRGKSRFHTQEMLQRATKEYSCLALQARGEHYGLDRV